MKTLLAALLTLSLFITLPANVHAKGPSFATPVEMQIYQTRVNAALQYGTRTFNYFIRERRIAVRVYVVPPNPTSPVPYTMVTVHAHDRGLPPTDMVVICDQAAANPGVVLCRGKVLAVRDGTLTRGSGMQINFDRAGGLRVGMIGSAQMVQIPPQYFPRGW